MDELVAEFLAEASEGLQTLDNELVELENKPEDQALLGSIFRVMHTIKGTCGFLGLEKLASVAHAGENIMDKIRNKQLPVNAENISIILEAVDTIKSIIVYIKDNGVEPDTEYTSLIKKINGSTNSIITSSDSQPKDLIEKAQQIDDHTKTEEPIRTEEAIKIDNSINHSSSSDHSSPQTIKVHVDVLENLMQIVSELVLNRNQLIQLERTLRDTRFTASVQRLNIITSSLQETIMETRMQPISNAWIKMPRMIRDLSRDLNKKIKLVMIGEDTELDRQLIESIKDPLVHMVRNSADHGIEIPAERIAAGKLDEGTVTLKAYHQGGHIIIEISDDGRGLNIDKIKQKALKNKLVTEKDLDEMSDTQITQFIFRAGFSTAEVVTAVSGRGVGMDVVKTNIEKIRGTVELKSIEGQGSVFTIKIPLTLAIMPILVVESANQRFGIPQINVIEMVHAGGSSDYVIEKINNNKVLRLRDSLLPLITLAEILEIEDIAEKNNKNTFVVICEVSGINFGLTVDRIYDTEEIVLKPVSKLLEYLEIYSGNTLLGNGDVIMILDPSGIAKFLTDAHKSDVLGVTSLEDENNQLDNKLSSFLVLKDGGGRKAIPLELVSRLEEIDATKIEIANGRPVIQYRGSLMFLSVLNPKYSMPKEGIQQVVVFGSNDHILGLIVEEILDIVEQNIESNLSFEDSDLSAIVLAGKTMDVVDVNSFFHQVFFASSVPLTPFCLDNKYHLLLVDDSPFFRKIITAILKDKGFEVSCVKSGHEALTLLEKNYQEINLIITDINMPRMDGLQFAKICKEDQRFSDIPIIALTSNVEIVDHNNVILSGIKACISKTDQGELIPLILSLLNIRR